MLLGTADPLLGGRTALAPLPVRQGDPAGRVQLAPERAGRFGTSRPCSARSRPTAAQAIGGLR